MNSSQKIIVGISIGDINGIGIEIILKTFKDKRMFEFCTPILFCSQKIISYYKKKINIDCGFNVINTFNKISNNKINIYNCWNEDVKIETGKLTNNGGRYALKSLLEATKALKNNKIDVLLTAPINKENIQNKDFHFPGHTEFLESNLKGNSLMILMTDELKIGLISGHIPVSKISKTITSELIKEKVEIMYTSLLQDFKINKPKIAILGLNPHCGDKGVIGDEDDKIVRPTINEIKKTGKLVFGPYSSDGFFGSRKYIQFDGVLAMYHDQGLAPFKALSFGKGINFTAGLNKIRTSPDHGTGFDIAGKNIADSSSFREALFQAIKIYRNRNEYLELKSNVLE